MKLATFMKQVADRLQMGGNFGTAHVYRSSLNAIIAFHGNGDLAFREVTPEWLKGFEIHLRSRGCSWNTVSTYMRRIRCVYNKAIEDGDAEYIPGLFQGVFTGVESKRKKSLSLENQHKLMTVKVESEVLRETQLVVCLLFQYAGMSFVDFAHLKERNIKNGILDYNRQKTGTPMRLEILDTAELMRKELMGDKKPASGYLFPFLSGTKTGYEAYLEYNAALSRFNRNLKALKKAAGIASDVTSYTIRHSFAMALKEQNVPIEMISELLGHKSIKTTQIYLRSFSLEKMTEVNSTCFGCVYNYVSKVG